MNIKTLLAAAAITIATAFGAIATTTTTAQAGDLTFSFEVGQRYQQPSPRFYDYNRFYAGERFYKPRARHCSPRRAIKKARRMGLRHPRIVRMNNRAIKVVGRARGNRHMIKFARNGRCSVLRKR